MNSVICWSAEIFSESCVDMAFLIHTGNISRVPNQNGVSKA